MYFITEIVVETTKNVAAAEEDVMATGVLALMLAAVEVPKMGRFMGSVMAFSTKIAKTADVASLAIKLLLQKEALPTANAVLFGNESTLRGTSQLFEIVMSHLGAIDINIWGGGLFS